MTLKLYNTSTRQLDNFTSLKEGEVLLYTCGPTVYNELHIGNWAAYIYWDVLIRVLKADNFKVKQIINITDVGHLTDDADNGDDKLEIGATREGKTAWEIAKKYTESYLKGREELNLLAPAKFAKATDFIPSQIELIKTLQKKGYVYQINDGLYFDTAKFPRYKEFAHLNLETQQAGARVSFNPQKRNLSDFAVWKFSPKDKKREMQWETPQELLKINEKIMGFPGWHIECSAIALDQLGETIDIHTGGIDHIPVHHTNEIAQSEGATGKKFANFWLHNNHMKANGVKISKSLGNGYTLNQLAQKGYVSDDFRMFVLQSHYQNESNFTFENLKAASNRLNNWREYATLRHQSYRTLKQTEEPLTFLPEPKLLLEILNNNLNTPAALSFIDKIFTKVATSHKKIDKNSFTNFLEAIDELLGFRLLESTPDINDEVKQLVLERRNVRERQDWAKADQIREKLLKRGIAVRDTSTGSHWYYV